MRPYITITQLAEQARKEHRCIIGTTPSTQKTLRRHYHAGTLIRPYRNLYAPADYWNQLNPCERNLHIMRALHIVHPNWVFTGLSALDVYNIDHSWRSHTGTIWIADTTHNAGFRKGPSPLLRITIPTNKSRLVQGLPVTSLNRAIADCLARLPFCQALSIIDSALHNGINKQTIQTACTQAYPNNERIQFAMQYADSRSENGGESFIRATIIQLGFAIPQLQVEIRDPNNPAIIYRPDFLWRLNDGQIIVLEFDGLRKYIDPEMTSRKETKEIVTAQIQRDAALKQAGVTQILHCYYDDGLHSERLKQMLEQAGIPRVEVPESLMQAREYDCRAVGISA